MRRCLVAWLACIVASAQTPAFDFKEATRLGNTSPRLHSVLASWHGQVILEQYFHGKKATSYANIKSASKSLLSVLIGIAIERKLIPGVNTPISLYFPEIAKDPELSKITIEDLLTMRSGLRTTSNRYYGAWVASPNWVRHVLTRPMEAAPGRQMSYSTGNTHLLSAILTKASQSNTWAFAQQVLAKPLGITLPQWPRDPQGIYFGGNDMLLTPRQMLAIGELYLHHGKAGSTQIVSERWVTESCTAKTISPRNGEGYGYGWWIGDFAGFQACYAWGFGGQYIFVLPQLDLVIVTTSSPVDGEDRREQRGVVFDLVEEQIIPQVASRMGLTAPAQ